MPFNPSLYQFVISAALGKDKKMLVGSANRNAQVLRHFDRTEHVGREVPVHFGFRGVGFKSVEQGLGFTAKKACKERGGCVCVC